MRRPGASRWRSPCAAWALAYALAMLYASTLVGPLGVHFVPINPHAALARLLASTYQSFGDEQRSDWLANLLMPLPLGVLVTAALSPPQRSRHSLLAAPAALLLCLGFVLTVKYAQLFFPPRTVNLNYILAQSLGAGLGVALFVALRHRLGRIRRRLADGGRGALLPLLWCWLAGLLLLPAFPYQAVDSVAAVMARAADTDWLVTVLPAADRPLVQRAGVALAGFAAVLPVGVLAVLSGRGTRLWRVIGGGLAVLALSALLAATFVDTTPVPLPLAAAGFAAGALAAAWRRDDLLTLRRRAARLVPLAVLPYLALVAALNGLLTLHWRTPAQAWAALDMRCLLPFWHDYIVSKEQAVTMTAAQVVMYAPIGVLLWLRHGDRRGVCRGAAGGAALLALAVEAARWFGPGVQPEFDQAAVAAAAAGFAVRLAAYLWRMAALPCPARPTR